MYLDHWTIIMLTINNIKLDLMNCSYLSLKFDSVCFMETYTYFQKLKAISFKII